LRLGIGGGEKIRFIEDNCKWSEAISTHVTAN